MFSKFAGSLEWFRFFFLNYFWFSIVLVLLSVVLDLEFPSNGRPYLLSIVIKIVESVGLAVLIASIFSFASGTSDFVDKIRKLLEDIVVRRNFLGNIDPEGKKEALKALIQPTVAEKNKYPNIGDYYGYFINKTLEIGSRCVRSNYHISSRAYFDLSKKKIAVEGIYSYRLYPSNDGYNDITVGFEEDNNGDSFCSYVAVSTPDGKRETHSDIQLSQVDQGGDVSSRASISVKKLGDKANHLDVEIKVTEYGTDHWALIVFKALQPTDGFIFQLRCDGDVRIKEHSIFVVGASYYLEQDKDDCRWITIGCNQWINEGSGLTVLVSIPHENLELV